MGGLQSWLGGSGCYIFGALSETNAVQLFHDRLIDHVVAFDRVFLELSLSLGQAITANLLLPIDTLEPESAVLWFELRECSIVCDIIGFVQESYELSAKLPLIAVAEYSHPYL